MTAQVVTSIPITWCRRCSIKHKSRCQVHVGGSFFLLREMPIQWEQLRVERDIWPPSTSIFLSLKLRICWQTAFRDAVFHECTMNLKSAATATLYDKWINSTTLCWRMSLEGKCSLAQETQKNVNNLPGLFEGLNWHSASMLKRPRHTVHRRCSIHFGISSLFWKHASDQPHVSRGS